MAESACSLQLISIYNPAYKPTQLLEILVLLRAAKAAVLQLPNDKVQSPLEGNLARFTRLH